MIKNVMREQRTEARRQWGLGGSVLCLGVLALLAGCGKGGAAASGGGGGGVKAVSVTVTPAEARDVQRTVHAVGTLAALEKVTLSNRVVGTAEKLLADMGDQVKPGQKLAQVETLRYELAVQQAEQSMLEALARLGLEKIPEEGFNVDLTAPVKKALSELNAAQIKFDRTEKLYKQQLVKDFEFFDMQAGLRVAESGVQDARDGARALLAQARQQRTVRELRQKDLLDTAIIVPTADTPAGKKIAGYTVAERRVSAGDYLREGTVLFTLVADGTLKLQARVPERYLAEVKTGQEMAFKVEAYPGEKFTGKVTALDPTVDTASRTFMVEATVDNEAGKLRAGSFVQAEILTRVDAGKVMVPVEAITSFAGVNKVFVVEKPEGKGTVARQVEVVMGQQESGGKGNWVELVLEKGGKQRGVQAGDLVVVTGQSKLVDGSVVEVRQPEAGKQTALRE